MNFKKMATVVLTVVGLVQPSIAQLKASDMILAVEETQETANQKAAEIVKQNEVLLSEIQKVEIQIANAKKTIDTNSNDYKRSTKIAIGVGVVFAGALAVGLGAQFIDSRIAGSAAHGIRSVLTAASERVITLGLGAASEEGQMRLIGMFVAEMLVAAGFGVNAGVNYVQVEFFNKRELASLELTLTNLKARLQAENLSLKQ